MNNLPAENLLAKDISFLPEPVETEKDVAAALQDPPISHRSALFQQKINEIKKQLINITGAGRAQAILGNGTLANDMIAAQLTHLSGAGLVLVNGEFGQRLKDHCLHRFFKMRDVKGMLPSLKFILQEQREKAG